MFSNENGRDTKRNTAGAGPADIFDWRAVGHGIRPAHRQGMTTHQKLAGLWAQWNEQRGTVKQIEQIMRQLSVEDLTRMLVERGVEV